MLFSMVILMASAPTSLNIKDIQINEWGTSFTPGPLYIVLFLYLIIYFSLAFKNLKKSYSSTIKKIERYQILYIFVAVLGTLVIGIFTNIILPLMGYTLFSKYGPSLALLFFTLPTSVSILKHRLLNVKIILTEALVFLLISILFIRIPIFKNTPELIFNIIILILAIGIGWGLIKSVLREIQRREEMEKISKELEKTYKELKKLDEAKSEFISIASHQLRTPLTAIKGYISLINEKIYGRPPKRMKKPLNNIRTSTERLIKLVGDLLNISRIEAGKIKLNIEKSQLEDIINSVVSELRNLAKEKKLYLKWKKPRKLLPKVLVDKGKIRQVVLNVIDNAIRYTERGGITIRYRKGNKISKLIISDTGEGMTKKEISNLFRSFTRGSTGQKTWTEGTGLGLYIAKKFLDLHNGKIWAKSPGRGKGSTFYIELPIE
jgi:signal transduction histidine kinase